VFAALASTPTLVLSPIWLSMILSELRTKGVADRDLAIELLMRVHTQVTDRMSTRLFEGLIPEEDAIAACREWARGYAAICDAAELSETDDELSECLYSFHILAEEPEALATAEALSGEGVSSVLTQLREDLVDSVAYLYESWLPGRSLEVALDEVKAQPVVRVGPKTGRNDPCPCGSGKKYKKCHG
jgi:uncharacterized protein YecA (UPF0149 family)